MLLESGPIVVLPLVPTLEVLAHTPELLHQVEFALDQVIVTFVLLSIDISLELPLAVSVAVGVELVVVAVAALGLLVLAVVGLVIGVAAEAAPAANVACWQV